jgi:hypothetical protein
MDFVMTSGLHFNLLPLLLPPFFALQCLEEFRTFIAFGDRHGIILPPSNGWELAGAMGPFLPVNVLASLSAGRAVDPPHWRMTGWLVLFSAVFLHALLNAGGAFWLREYAPGAFVSGLVYIPFGIHLFRRALREGWLSWERLAGVLTPGLVSYAGLVTGTLLIGKAVHPIEVHG